MTYEIEYFLDKCDDVDIELIIEQLISRGHLPTSVKQMLQASAGELHFEQALSKIHGKWNQLSAEEEDSIIKISKRF